MQPIECIKKLLDFLSSLRGLNRRLVPQSCPRPQPREVIQKGSNMKQIVASRTLVIPEGVDIKVKSRQVYVKGPRGDTLYCGSRPGSQAFLPLVALLTAPGQAVATSINL